MLSLDHDFEKRLPLSHRLVKTVGTLREYRGMEAKYRQQTPQVLESLRQAAVIQSVESSNRIEGVIAPLGRIRAIVADNDAPRDRPEAEIAGYRDVLDTIHGSHEGIRLTSGVVQQFHRQLFARTDVRGGGEWKVQPNDIVRIHAGGRQEVRFSPPAPHLVGGLMQSLHDGLHAFCDAHTVDELLIIPAYVLDFLCIHPFPDGNGRMARLLTLLLLYQAGYEVGRFISLEQLIEKSKRSYYDTLHKSSQGWHEGRHDLTPWTEYLLGTLVEAYRAFESRVGQVTTAKGAKTHLVEAVIEGMIGEFTAQDVLAKCPTASLDLVRRILTQQKALGHLERIGEGRGSRWRRTA